MNTEITKAGGQITELALQHALTGDISQLSPSDRLKMLAATCASLNLNPMTKPFDFVELNGKMVMYANKGCAEQLRKVHGVSVEVVERIRQDGIYAVRVKATDQSGRTDEAIGVVPCDEKAKGDFVAMAMMKAETKAKRRVTFSICGLSMPDIDELRVNTMKPASASVITDMDDDEKVGVINNLISAQSHSGTCVPQPSPTVITLSVGEGTQASFTPEIVHKPEPKPEPVVEQKQEAQPEPDKGGNISQNEAAWLESELCLLPDPKAGVDYLVAKGKLPKGKPLTHIDLLYFTRIKTNPAAFIEAVRKTIKPQ